MTSSDIQAAVDAIAADIGGSKTLGARFIAKFKIESDGCWEWNGACQSRGYGHLALKSRRLIYAHRLAHLALKGPIHDGTEIDHLCRNRRCVNPDHLEAVSHLVNVRRGESPTTLRRQGKRPASTRTHCFRGHELTDENKVLRVNGTYDCRICRRLRKKRSRDPSF